MRNIKSVCLVLLYVCLAMLLVLPVGADTHRYVDAANGDNGNDGTADDSGHAWKTITHALNETTGGSGNLIIIHVAAGTYDTVMGGGEHESFPIRPQNYDVIEGAGAAHTIVDADESDSVFKFENVHAGVRLAFLTITDGDADMGGGGLNGGGIRCINSDPEVVDCTITGNVGWHGGGVSCNSSSPTFTGCAIDNNRCLDHGGGVWCENGSSSSFRNCTININVGEKYGGGLACEDSSAIFVNTQVNYNQVGPHERYGGGVYLGDGSNVEFAGCHIDHNTGAQFGGGIHMWGDSEATLHRTTISWNEALMGSHQRGGGICAEDDSVLTMEHCTVDNNKCEPDPEMPSAGGGLHLDLRYGRHTVRWTEITNNEACAAAGISVASGDPENVKIEHCFISGNKTIAGSAPNGAGISCSSNASPSIFNCLITDNRVDTGGNGAGICCRRGSSPEIVNCTIADNEGHGVYAIADDANLPTLTNCILWGNDDDLVNVDCSLISHCDIEDGDCEGSDGNIRDYPYFVSGPDGDYYLSQYAAGQSEQSGCIDGGDNTAAHHGLDTYTTRTDHIHDWQTVDMGYHYRVGEVFYVDDNDGNNSNDGRSYKDEGSGRGPWMTLTHALQSIPDGSEEAPVTIMIAEGSYDTGFGDETFPLEPRTGYVELIGDGADTTVIDADGSDTAVLINAKDNVTIHGLTIQEGHSSSGGGIRCIDSDGCLVEDCVLQNNHATMFGGAFYCSNCSPGLKHCIIRDNTTDGNGAGIYAYQNSAPSIFNCLITANTADADGGGVYLESNCDAEIVNCTVEGNSPSGIAASMFSEPTITNSILWSNGSDLNGDSVDCSKVTYCDIQNGDCSGEETNMSDDPLFVPRNPENEDEYTGYYLAQTDAQGGDSPCLNKGDDQASGYSLDALTTCTDGRYDEGVVDMGYHYRDAYEGDDNTYIELTSFEAKPCGKSILITWETGSEIDNAGFSLYRIEDGDRTTRVKINDRLIQAEGAPAIGASYEFLDVDVGPGITYDYYLVDIDTSGTETVHGPVSARVVEGPRSAPDNETSPYIEQSPGRLRPMLGLLGLLPVL